MNRESIPTLGTAARAGPRAAPRLLDGPCAWLSWGLPLVVGIGSASGEASWGDDLGIVRDLGFARVGHEGVVSTLLTQLLTLLPLGGRLLRASLLGVFALALASRLFFGAIRAALDRSGRAAIHPVLAVFASALWCVGPALLGEATRVGGPLVAVALLLIGLRLAPAAFGQGDPRALVGIGLALGAALAESHAAAACFTLSLATEAMRHRQRAWPSEAWRLVAAFAGAFVLLGSLRWFWPSSALTLPAPGPGLLTPMSSASIAAGRWDALAADAPGVSALAAGLVQRIASELGAAALLLACCGAAWAAWSAALRRTLAPWAFVAVLGAVLSIAERSAPPSQPLFALLCCLGAAAFVPFALQGLVRALWKSAVPLARPAALLLLVFASTLVLSRADQARLASEPRRAAEAWTEEALGKLPTDSLLLVQSSPLAFRLLASRALHGTRPDVVILPAALLGQSSLGRELQRSHPSASPLLRQLWVNGTADEYSLSRLADDRPVFVELDASWDRRLLEHLRPEGLWLGFSAHALGASERRAASMRVRPTLRRIIELSGAEAGLEPRAAALDPETQRALGDAVGRGALSLAALGEREAALRMLGAARHIDRYNPLVIELSARLAEPGGHVAASDLLE